ncbi:hypothetical protein M8J77_007110 [Diaphorina citri]|nr:hypothetical protein M8J77_007110 [Diaphorina citri]
MMSMEPITIKRPYFHVKALEKCQLKNWKDYLDFEISKGNEERILVLFERCLIACALYEEFWYKYICYLVDKPTPDVEKIREIYIRACTIHHPKKVNLHFEWAAFEEKYGYPDKAREILEKIEKEHIKLIEIPLRRIALEKRTKQPDTVNKLYEKYLNQWKDEELAKNYFDLAIKYARYSALVLKDVDKAVQILKSAIETEKEKEFRSFQDFTRLHFQLIDTVLHRPQISTSEIVSYLDSMLERSGLTPQQKFYIVTRKLEILEEFGDDITLINKTIQEFRSLSEQAMKAQLESQKMNIPLESVPLPKEKTNVVIVSSDEETDANPSTNTDASPSTNTDANPSTNTDASPSTNTDANPSTNTDANPSTNTDASPSTNTDANPSTNTDANLSNKLADKKTNISTNSSSPIVLTSEHSVVNVTKPTVTTSNTTNQAITIVKREKSPDRDCVQVKADPPVSKTTSDKEPENKCRFFSTNFKKLLQLVPRIPPGTVLPYKHVQTRETRTQSRNARWRNTAARKKLESHFRDYHFRMFSTPISVKEREGKKPMVRSLVSIRVFPKPFPEQPCPPGELESPSVPSSSDPIESLSIPSSSDPSSTSSNSDATSSSIDAIIDQIWDMKKFLNTNSNPDSSSDEVEILNTDSKSKPRSPEVITISSTPSNSKSKSPNEVTTVNKTKKSKAKKIEEVVVLKTISPAKPVADITYENTISNVNTTSTLYKAKKNKKKKKRGKKNTISNVKAPSSVTYLNTVTNTATSLPEILEVHPRPTIPPVTPVTQTSASTPVTHSFTSMLVSCTSASTPVTHSFTSMPVSCTSASTSVTHSFTSMPVSCTSASTPVTHSFTSMPVSCTSASTPVTHSFTSMPVSCTSASTPVTHSFTSMPVSYTSASTPVTHSFTSMPVSYTSASTPVTHSFTSMPVSYTSASTPVTHSFTSMPVSFTSASTPVTHSFTSMPVSYTSASTPVTHSFTSMPVSYTSASTPVTHSFTSMPVSYTSASTPVTHSFTSMPVSYTSASTPVTHSSASTPITHSSISSSVACSSNTFPIHMPLHSPSTTTDVPSHTVPNTKATSFTKLTISKSQSTSEPSTSLPQALPAPRPVIFPNYPRIVNKPVTTIVSGIRPNPVPRFSNTPRSLANTIGNQMNPTPSQSHANLTSTTESKQTNTLLASLDEDMKELKKREEVLKKILANLIISSTKKPKPPPAAEISPTPVLNSQPEPPTYTPVPPAPPNPFFPGPPPQGAPQFMPPNQFPTGPQPGPYPGPVPPNFGTPYGVDPNNPAMYQAWYGGPNYGPGNWGYPGNYQGPPNQPGPPRRF